MVLTERHEKGAPEEVALKSRIKWFNSSKGFGFAVPDEDPCDAFVHITTLQDAGIDELGEGAEIMCHVVKGPKGALVTKVESLVDIGENPLPITFRTDIEDDEVIEEMNGTVKWYKEDKGFGFVIPEDGQKDVFIHKTCLEKNGIETLLPGQKLSMNVRSVDKGREVLDFELTE
ncbi:MAG: cold shock domain-containing protein [Pseudomonadota bacterium]